MKKSIYKTRQPIGVCVCVVGPFTRIEITDAIVPCHKPTNKSMALSKTFHVIRSDEGMALANVHTHARRRTIFAHKVNWLVFRFSKHCEVSLWESCDHFPFHSCVCLHLRISSSNGPKSCQQKAAHNEALLSYSNKSNFACVLHTCWYVCVFAVHDTAKLYTIDIFEMNATKWETHLFTFSSTQRIIHTRLLAFQLIRYIHTPCLSCQTRVSTSMWHSSEHRTFPSKIKIHFFSFVRFSFASMNTRPF